MNGMPPDAVGIPVDQSARDRLDRDVISPELVLIDPELARVAKAKLFAEPAGPSNPPSPTRAPAAPSSRATAERQRDTTPVTMVGPVSDEQTTEGSAARAPTPSFVTNVPNGWTIDACLRTEALLPSATTAPTPALAAAELSRLRFELNAARRDLAQARLTLVEEPQLRRE